MIRVAVIGSAGRMGATVCDAVGADPELELVVGVDWGDKLEAVLDAGADVAVEFTGPDSVKSNTAWLLERGVHVVVGATGLDDADLGDLERLTGPSNLFVAPNFAIGAVLMMEFAQRAAEHFPHVEITELHHDGKADAPSGTALRTAKLIAQRRGRDTEPPGPKGSAARGEIVDGISVHSVRLPGLVAHQEVLFGGQGQTLTIRHDSIDRGSFMPGVLLAVKRVQSRPGLTVGLEAIL